MKQTDEILRLVEKGEASEEEIKMAEEYLLQLEQRLSSRIDSWESKTASAPDKSRKMWIGRLAVAAACLLAVISVTFWFDSSGETAVTSSVQKDTFTNPEDAAHETEMALMKFSAAINKATCYHTK